VRPRILIAHPDADLRMSARASLERAGYEIVSAADGLEALRTAIAQRPAVVIADAIMPKMDGRELCQLLKSQEKTANIRVILLTRATDAPPKGDLLPDEVLRKPVPLETLKSTLAALLAAQA
jgi:CheY-like chemotaxis protein